MKPNDLYKKESNAAGPFDHFQKPYLLTRMGAALLDFLLIFILFALIETTFYFTIFTPLGYHESIDETRAILLDSHLYVEGEYNKILTITETYNEELTLEENYDVPIVYYYTNDDRAVRSGRLDSYYISKENSGYFDRLENDVFTRKEGVSEEKFEAFFVSSYEKAVAFLEDDPAYLRGVQRSFYIVLFTSLGSITIASLLIHLLVPMISKHGQTPFKFVFKICLIDARDETQVKKWQILVRFFILIFFNIWVPVIIYARFVYATTVPLIVSAITLFVTRTNSSPHDFIAKTYVVSKRDVHIPKTRVPEVIEEELWY